MPVTGHWMLEFKWFKVQVAGYKVQGTGYKIKAQGSRRTAEDRGPFLSNHPPALTLCAMHFVYFSDFAGSPICSLSSVI